MQVSGPLSLAWRSTRTGTDMYCSWDRADPLTSVHPELATAAQLWPTPLQGLN